MSLGYQAGRMRGARCLVDQLGSLEVLAVISVAATDVGMCSVVKSTLATTCSVSVKNVHMPIVAVIVVCVVVHMTVVVVTGETTLRIAVTLSKLVDRPSLVDRS